MSTKSAKSVTNPFATEQAWEVNLDEILPAGDHLTKIQTIEFWLFGGKLNRSSGGYPMMVVHTGNEKGTIRNWLVITQAAYGKVVQLIQAAGVAPPTDDEVTVDEDTGFYVPNADYISKLVGKQVGTIVRSEKDDRNSTPMNEVFRDNVKGYVSPDQLKSDVPSDASGFDQSTLPTSQPVADDDIPF
jgi:hypothetical protein